MPAWGWVLVGIGAAMCAGVFGGIVLWAWAMSDWGKQ